MNSKSPISIVYRSYNRNFSGVHRYTVELLKNLVNAESGLQINVIHGDAEVPAEEWLNHRDHYISESMKIKPCEREILLASTIEKSESKVIHYTWGGSFPANFTPGNKLYIITLHGFMWASDAGWLTEEEKQHGKKMVELFALNKKKISRIITGTKWVKKHLMSKFGFSKSDVSAVTYGINFKQFRRCDVRDNLNSYLQHRFNLRNKFILWVGDISVRKNLGTLLGSFVNLKEYYQIPHQLVLIGVGKSSNVANLLGNSNRSLTAEDIILLSAVRDQDLMKLYNGADLFVFPSLFEGFGFPVAEAMACGTPVITSKCSALPEVAGNAALLLDDPEDDEELAASILKVLNNGNLRRKLIRRGIKRATRFSWEKCARLHTEVYREVLAQQIPADLSS